MRNRQSWILVVAMLALPTFAWSCRRSDPTVPPAVSPAAVAAPPGPPAAVAAPGVSAAGAASSTSRVVVQVTEEGFVPSHIPAEAGKPIILAVTRKTDKTCARELVIKGKPGKTALPLDKEVEVSYTPIATGTVPFGCAMGMMVSGAIEVR